MVPIIMMPKVTGTPRVNSWTPTTRNYRAPNDAPHNLPYFEDDVRQNDKQLVDEIEKVLGEQLSLSTTCLMSDVDEKVLYEAVCEIKKRITGTGSNPGKRV